MTGETRHRRALLKPLVVLGVVALLVLLLAGMLWSAPGGRAAGNSIVTVDTSGIWTSLALDSSGNPVVSYYDELNDDLRVLHCGNPNCTSGNSIELPDTAGNVGLHTSLALDASGNPVVSYFDETNDDLRVLHCGNPNCSSGNSIELPDTEGDVGRWTSLALDSSGNPVVSYLDDVTDDLKVLHCNDPNCAGANESITSPDTEGNVGRYNSLVLDCSDFDPNTRRCLSLPGNPVVSYWVGSISDLKLLHCGNPNCGPGNAITSPDMVGSVGRYTSLVLDGSGNPVVSYRGSGSISPLKLLHCNDASCAGDDESITSPDTAGNAGLWTSLALDGSGNPVVSYYEAGGRDLRVLHCGDPDCSSGNAIASPDMVGSVGQYTSLVLDGSGNPVVSYNGGSLKILHCADPNCTGVAPTPTPTATNGIIGDCNGDGDVTIVDLVLIAQFLGGVIGPDDLDLAACDINSDGDVTITDLVLVAQFLGGVIPGLPPA